MVVCKEELNVQPTSNYVVVVQTYDIMMARSLISQICSISSFTHFCQQEERKRTNVRLQPTTECLVHLIDLPFLVVTLNEIKIASLERVQFSLKQFDLVLTFKDFTKAPLHINSIFPSSKK
jgi:hypothetical protein